MRKFLHLLRNEFSKILHRKVIWVMVILFALLSLGVAVLSVQTDDESEYETRDSWESQREYYSGYLNDKDKEGEPTDYAREAYRCVLFYDKALLLCEDGGDWRMQSHLIEMWAAEKYVYDFAIDTSKEQETLIQTMEKILDTNDVNAYYDWYYLENLAKESPQYTDAYRRVVTFCKETACLPCIYDDPLFTLVNRWLDAKTRIIDYEELIHAGAEINEERYAEARDEEAILNYQVANRILENPKASFSNRSSGLAGMLLNYIIGDTGTTSSFWNAMAFSNQLSIFIGLLLIILAGGIVSREFSQGTIKFLLVNPVKRWKILVSKYVTILILGVLFYVILFVTTFLSAGIADGFSAVFDPGIGAKDGVVYLSSPYGDLLISYLLSGIEVLLMLTLAFSLSSLTKNTAVSVGVALFTYLFGGIAVLLLKEAFECDWARYLLFANTDLWSIAKGLTDFPHQSLSGAIVILCAHMAVFWLTAWDGFLRHDV